MADVLECEGAPRDLGLDQGRFFRSALRAELLSVGAAARLRHWLRRGSARARRIERDLRRYFPQQAEAVEGMSRGAGVPRSWLVEKLAREAARADSSGGVAAAVGSAGALVRSLPAGAFVRRSRPEGGFASVELVAPWRTAPLAGVNQGGLAAVAVERACLRVDEPCAAPASLLAFDCLARFDTFDGAIDWLLGRPAGGDATVLLADARGEIGGVRFRDGARELLRPADGLLVDGAGSAREAEIAKGLRAASPLDARDVPGLLGEAAVFVDVASLRIGLAHTDGDVRWTSTPEAAAAS